MSVQGSSGKGHKNRKIGRYKAKCERYRRENCRAKNKVKKVLKSCGLAFAKAWALKYGVRLPEGAKA
jgi:hypothetical protein